MTYKCMEFIHQGPLETVDNALTERTNIQSIHCLNCDEYWEEI